MKLLSLILIGVVFGFFLFGFLVGLAFQANFIVDYVNKECNEFLCEGYPHLCDEFDPIDPFILLENGTFETT